ncbi:hypothetical protein ACH0B5_16295 [Ureibacillus sp. 179-F W5.1 NHS]|uniref:Uncharacterized protein n=1 Tax=Lysinibacillus halotolerans TaxID=1368476 RepID=A0A3M8H8A5_9BACI|nr:hypothetical protein [Lysinibacillus halotolerans]RNC98655.1 hypothetical protein EC501_10500 [Lysinibacillus halotolerans]
MRTSRVQPTPSAIFRNSRQYLQSGEQFYRLMEDGGYHPYDHQREPQRRKKQKDQAKDVQKRVLKKTSTKLLVKGMYFDTDSIASVQNSLLKRSATINSSYNKVSRIQTYRTSI